MRLCSSNKWFVVAIVVLVLCGLFDPFRFISFCIWFSILIVFGSIISGAVGPLLIQSIRYVCENSSLCGGVLEDCRSSVII